MLDRVVMGSLLAIAALTGSSSAADDKDVFGRTKIWSFDLRVSAKDWAAMSPVGGIRFPGFGGPGGPGGFPRPEEKPADRPKDIHKTPGWGMEYPWVHGDLAVDGRTLKNVGVRFKGNYTYTLSAGSPKRSLKIDLDHYDDTLRFHGLKKLNLNSGVTDPTRAIETMSFAVFRAAGVPAPRTAFAQVTLTVPGKYDKEYLGLYTLVEQVDKTFLKNHFKNARGLLLKPEGLRGLEHLGDDWEPYSKRYYHKGEATKEQQKRLIDFTRLIEKADDEKFRKEIGSYLDVEQFLRYLAANALLANLDSFLGFGHNFYLYLRPDTNKFVFIPWDVDLAFGKWPPGGTFDQQADLSIVHPHPGANKLIDRLLAMKDVNDRYRNLLKDLSATAFAKEKLLEDLDAVETATKEMLAKEKKAATARRDGTGGGFGPPGGTFGQQHDLRKFIEKRTASVADQLAGKSKGHVPGAFGFGPPVGGFGGMPQPGRILQPIHQDILKLTPAQRKELETLQKTIDAELEKLLTEQQRKQLKQMREPPRGFGPPGGP